MARAAFLILALAWGATLRDAEATNETERAEAGGEKPGNVEKEQGTDDAKESKRPPGSFKASEEVPVDMAIDFPVDI